MNPKSDIVFQFIKQLSQLKELLKCPICLEGIEDCIELDCSHRLCEKCYNEYWLSKKQNSCPICVKKVHRRTPVFKNFHVGLFGNHVNKTVVNLEKVLNCKIHNFKTKDDVLNTLRKIETDPIIPLSTKIVQNTTKLSNTSLKEKISKSTQAATSRRTDISNIKNLSNKENAFDKLMGSGLNSKRSLRTYVNKRKRKDQAIVADKVLEFEDSDNKIKIVQWLTDSRNIFDTITYTQPDRTSQISYSDSFDLPSVSQAIVPKPTLLTSEHFESDKTRRIKLRNTQKKRARSLDIKVIKQPEKKYLKRHSLACDTPDFEKYVIEDINTEEDNPKLKQKISNLEDQFLNSIDQEMIFEKIESKQSTKVGKHKKQKKSNKSEKKPSPSGWERMKKISRTLRKSEKLPKQLNITTGQSTQLTKEITSSVKETHKEKPPVTSHIETGQPTQLTKEMTSSVKENKEKPSVISHIETAHSTQLTKDISSPVKETSKEKLPVTSHVETIDEKMKNVNVSKKTNLTKPKLNIDEDRNRNEVPITVGLKHMESFFSKNITKIKCNTSNESDQSQLSLNNRMDVDFYPSNIKDKKDQKPSGLLKDSFIQEPTRAKINQTITEVALDDDELEVFSRPTQKIIFDDEQVDKITDTIEDEDIFYQPTQKILISEVLDKSLNSHQILSECEKKFELFNKSLHTSSYVTPSLKQCFGELQSYVLQLKNSLKIAVEEEENKQDKNDSFFTADCMTQTVSAARVNKFVQTDILTPQTGFQLSTTDVHFATQNLTQTSMQTDAINCPNCKIPFNFLIQGDVQYQEKLSSSNNNEEHENVIDTRKNSEDAMLIDFLDNGEFDTQQLSDADSFKKLTNSNDHKQSRTLNNITNELHKSQNSSKVKNCSSVQLENNLSIAKAESKTQNIVTYKKSQKIKKNAPTQNFNTQLDFEYDTQDIIKQDEIQRHIPNSNSQQVSCSLSRTRNRSTQNDSQDSELLCTIDTNVSKVNRKLSFSNEKQQSKQKFKRIRVNNSDSESDGEHCVKKTCTRIGDDVPVVGLSNKYEKLNTKENKNDNGDSFKLSEGSDDINYDEYLEQVMKKYSPNNKTTTSKEMEVPTNTSEMELLSEKKTYTDIVSKCDDIIQNTRKYFEPSSNKNINLSQQNEHFAKSLSSDISDIIAETEPLLLTPKVKKKAKALKKVTKPTEILMENSNLNLSGSLFVNSESFIKNLKNQQKLKAQKTDVQQLENEIDIMEEINIANEQFQMDVDFENIDEPIEKNQDDNEKICIIGNVLIKDAVPEILENNKSIRDSIELEDAIVISDTDDVDVIETTPQKQIEKRSISESSQKPVVVKEVNNLDFGIEPLDLDMALPPPPEFQDFEENNKDQTLDVEKDNNDLKACLGAFTPDDDDICAKLISLTHVSGSNEENQEVDNMELHDHVERFFTPNRLPKNRIRNVLSTKKPSFTSTQNSEPMSEQFLNFSPIPVDGKTLNLIDITKQSKYSPLTITSKPQIIKPTKQQLSSTPRQKSILNYMTTSQENKSEPSTSSVSDKYVKKKPCVACTRLSKDQVIAISSLTNKKLATYSNSFTRQVTHLIVSVDEKNCIKDHTIKFVSAIAAGIWVLNFTWIQDCLAANSIVPEEPYEALDTSGIAGPKLSRLTRHTNPLFKGYKIHAAAPFLSTTKEDVEEVITLLGGKVIKNLHDISKKDDDISLIIAEARATQDFELYETWLEALRVVTVDIEWLSRSIGQYKLLSLRPFTLCSDDSICDLGYPADLVINLPFSFSQNTYSSSIK